MKKFKTIIPVFAAFAILSSNAFAATGTAEKKLNSTLAVDSVAIQGDGGTGYHYTNVVGGTGSGWSQIYKFNRFWPDTKVGKQVDVASGGLEYSTKTFATEWDQAYKVRVDGTKSIHIRSSVVIN